MLRDEGSGGGRAAGRAAESRAGRGGRWARGPSYEAGGGLEPLPDADALR